jgi:hypothetical protein
MQESIDVKSVIRTFLRHFGNALRDLLPIILVIVAFQLMVLRQPIPNVAETLAGALFVVLGLMFFVQGLEMGLFPIGEAMVYAFARKGSLAWLLFFGFLLGFSTTVAEPALIAITGKAAAVAAEAGYIAADASSQSSYALQLRLTVALSVGAAVVLGIFRILRGWPVQYLVIGGYAAIVLMSFVAPEAIVGIAFDSGGVTTSTVTVPLATALGVGLATSIRGRDPLVDGFGMIALASLTPMIFVMVLGILRFGPRIPGTG